jgi:hypothetical protein
MTTPAPQSDNEFFRPLWRRAVLVAVVAGWFLFEMIVSRDTIWMVLTGAALAYAIWNFLLRYPDPPPGGGDAPPPAP